MMDGPDPRDRPSHVLSSGNVLCLQAFRAFLDFKFHRLPFVQRFVTIPLNRGEVDKNILPRLALDKTEAL